VGWVDGSGGLHLDDHLIGDNQIGPVLTDDNAVVPHRKCDLSVGL
jgi:hypothetical protein